MAPSQPNPVWRARIEAGIALASPLLDLVLAVGDRVSRVVHRGDPGYVPARVERPGDSARRAISPRR